MFYNVQVSLSTEEELFNRKACAAAAAAFAAGGGGVVVGRRGVRVLQGRHLRQLGKWQKGGDPPQSSSKISFFSDASSSSPSLFLSTCAKSALHSHIMTHVC